MHTTDVVGYQSQFSSGAIDGWQIISTHFIIGSAKKVNKIKEDFSSFDNFFKYFKLAFFIGILKL